MDFKSYDIHPDFYDEMFLNEENPREHYRQLYETLQEFSAEQMVSIQEQVTRSFYNEGISFTVYGDEEGTERIIPIDCVPRVVSSEDWAFLEKGLKQRLKALNMFLDDVYNDGSIIEDGVIPVDVVMECPQYRTEMRGFSPPHGTWVAIWRHGPGPHERRFSGAGGQSAGAIRRVLHGGQSEGHKGHDAPTVPQLPGGRGGALRSDPATDAKGAGARRSLRANHGPSYPRRFQLCLSMSTCFWPGRLAQSWWRGRT